MQEVNFKINVEADKANKNVKEVNENVQDVGQSVENANESTKDLGKQGSKNFSRLRGAADKSKKALKGVGTGFKVLGGAIKAAGIGLVVAVVAKLTEAFNKNQAIVDSVNKVMTSINIVFQEVTTAITNAFESTSKANGGFASTIAVIKNLMTLALTPLKLSFDAIKLVVQEAMLAWEKSMFGDGDPDTIKELNKGIEETKQSIKETGEEALDAGKGVAENFGDMISEVAGFVEKASEEVSKVNVDAASETADALVEMRKQVKLGEASLAGLTLQFQDQAEQLRQQRDDISKSIEDRIKANQKLGKILQKQSEEELKIAQRKLDLAQKELDLNPENIDAEIALQEAKNGVFEINERIRGQQSEQLTNEQALIEEQKSNLAELKKIGLKEVELAKQEANQKFQEEKDLIKKTIKEGAKRDELLKKAKKQFDLEMGEIEAEENEKKVQRQKELEALLNEGKEFPDTIEGRQEQALAELDIEREKEMQKARDLEASESQLQAIRDKFTKQEQYIKDEAAEQEKAREKAVADAKMAIVGNTLGAITQLLGENSKAGKAAAIAQAAINTYQGVTEVWSTPSVLPEPFATASRIASTATVLASGLKAVQNIKSTKTPNIGGSGGGSTGGASVSQAQAQAQQAQAPAFNIVGDAGTNQIAETLGQNGNQPLKAYVVSKDVSNQQELDRNIETGASLG